MTDSLWEFASTRYERAGVAELCLELQDEWDADINLLLAGAWLGGRGQAWQATEVAGIVAACAQWRSVCLLPLRRIRRDLKNLAGAEGWYQRIKALELEAERQQLHRMEEILRSSEPIAPATDRDIPAIVEANLSIYLETLPASSSGRSRTAATALARLLADD